MKVLLESTAKVVNLTINGVEVPARVWQGQTVAGVPCFAFVTRIAAAEAEDRAEFERDLLGVASPRPDVEAIPPTLIL